MATGASRMHVVSASITLNEDLDSFDQPAFVSRLAALLSVPTSAVGLVATSGKDERLNRRWQMRIPLRSIEHDLIITVWRRLVMLEHVHCVLWTPCTLIE